MENRKITIVETKNQRKSVIMSAATTLAELKRDLDANNIDYTNMTFFEGTSKVELKNNESVLPHDIPYKGTITNELVFMLTNSNKKIRSGAMSRMEAYNEIKKLGLQELCKEKFGKNFTMCKTGDLIALVEGSKDGSPSVSVSNDSNDSRSITIYKDQEEVSTKSSSNNTNILVKAINRLVGILEDNDIIDENEKYEVLSILNNTDSSKHTPEHKSTLNSSYSDDEIDAMFKDMSI